MDRLLNLFSAVSNSVSISGWPSPGGETLSNSGPYHGQAAQPVSLQSPVQDGPPPVVKPSLIEALYHGQAAQPILYSLQLCLYFRMALPRWCNPL
ncbi:hypothetical protein DPMN_147134 [Dreissena polymorpha]|uniref:Uncharacterized protein n=1 Tax=Dreissena polymorpha TaxID=45954 RepID=A0A9D4FBM4_DREPO|nr:hypothetical protein DPMN_147134 [Dreissena polymorpha]